MRIMKRILNPKYSIEIYTESTEKSISVLKVLYNLEVEGSKCDYKLERFVRNIEYSSKNSLNRIKLVDMSRDTSRKIYEIINRTYPELECIKRRSW